MENRTDLSRLMPLLQAADRVVASTGSGISAESGVPTFRGKDGLWKTYRAEELATPMAFEHNPHLVWEWYDWRRQLMAAKAPNAGHRVLAEWEDSFPSFSLITQNIDGLHAKAGSRNILELHGNIWKLRCTQEGTLTENHETPLEEIPPLCSQCGSLLRPHVVWFGESLDMDILRQASQLSSDCDIMFVVGTSAVVQPAASLPLAALEAGAKIVEINPEPTPLTPHVHFSFRGKAGEILPQINDSLKQAGKIGLPQ
ncbi:MAG: NAD-dependent protein deacylase [Candidatus Aminicenantes bacterium]|nr:NAD-dependent protein deacylase [Candidatus Aminicenantes bacterium]